MSIHSQRLPAEWKEGQVTPIFKKGSRSSPGNYRPVSLTSVICKLLESIVRNALMEHMEEHLTQCQHGFLTGRSCTTQLLDTMDLLTEFLDNREAVDVIFLDFAKAFDSVPHQRLVTKLAGYGVGGRVLGWIKDFLTERRQRVCVNGATSSWNSVLSGIPQGSVLGPVLFICFVNDMPEAVENFIRMFADDTKIFAAVRNASDGEKLQRDLQRLQEWTKVWQLRFNTGKCKVMHLGTNNCRHVYSMDGESGQCPLLETECEKDLGVHVDPALKFSAHCEKAASKANRLVGLIRRSFNYIDAQMMVQLFKSIVRPHLEYANVVWSPLYKKDSELLENVQRRATKLVPELRNCDYEERLRLLGLPSLTYRRLRGDLIEVL